MQTQPHPGCAEMSERNLQLVIEIFPLDTCPLKSMEPEASVVDIRPTRMDSTCHCEFVVEHASEAEGGRRVAHNQPAFDNCPCCTFSDFGCIQTVREIRRDSFLVETYVENREQAFDLLEGLEAARGRVELQRITQSHDGHFSEQLAQIDLSELTEKQREALDAAVNAGYFENPRRTTLKGLADDFDISKQAFGQRLSTAERKIIHQLCR